MANRRKLVRAQETKEWSTAFFFFFFAKLYQKCSQGIQIIREMKCDLYLLDIIYFDFCARLQLRCSELILSITLQSSLSEYRHFQYSKWLLADFHSHPSKEFCSSSVLLVTLYEIIPRKSWPDRITGCTGKKFTPFWLWCQWVWSGHVQWMGSCKQ